MTTLFISDLHLDDHRPLATELFEQFIAGEAMSAEAVYILGDLFEYWLGDDAPTATSARVADALKRLAGSGVSIYFMHGNRDFLLGASFARQCGMKLLPEAVVVDLYGTPTLLLHGDTLCTDDHAYQAARTMLRSTDWQQEFLSKSIADRMAFAADARSRSKAHQQDLSMDIMDVNQQSVRSAFEYHGVREMIHGHTHRPAIHRIRLEQGGGRRIVLGDWYQNGSVLRVSKATRELVVL